MTVATVDEAIDALRGDIGRQVAIDAGDSFVTMASVDSFRHFATGTGDFNPLWWDDEYAEASPRRGRTAPPTWLVTVGMPYQALLPLRPHGWKSLDGDIRWEFFDHVRPGDTFDISAHLTEVVEKPSRALGRAILAHAEAEYRNQRNKLVAKATAGLWFFPGTASSGAGGTSASAPVVEPVTACDEVPLDALGGIKRRGADPLLWSQVSVGDEIAPMHRPTLTAFEIMAWCVGSGTVGFEKIARGERAEFVGRPVQEVEQRSVMRHILPELSRRDGLPGGFDVGTQRTAWLGQLVSDWMGDSGELIELYCRFGRLLFVGDSPVCGGTVVDTYVENSRHLVRLELWVRNQRGEKMSDASALVALPE